VLMCNITRNKQQKCAFSWYPHLYISTCACQR